MSAWSAWSALRPLMYCFKRFQDSYAEGIVRVSAQVSRLPSVFTRLVDQLEWQLSNPVEQLAGEHRYT